MLISYAEISLLSLIVLVLASAFFLHKQNLSGRHGFAGLAVTLLASYVIHLLYKQFPNNLVFLIEPLISIFLITLVVPWKMDLEQFSTELPLIKYSFWQDLHRVYLAALLLLTITLIVPHLSFGTRFSKKTSQLIFLAAFIPFAVSIFFTEFFEGGLFKIQMYAFTFSSVILSVHFLKTKQNSLPLLTREHVVESMHEGWVLLDTENRIVDVNPSAERILYTSKASTYGKEAKVIFARWPNIAKALETQQEFDSKGSLNIDGHIRYLHVRILRIQNSRGLVSGRLVLLRDHTERRQAEAARQEARDEMFSLLHSISGAASRSENTNDFIVATMYQLGYSFETKAIAIFLVDQELYKNKHHFLLVAHQGVASENVKEIAHLDQSFALISELAKTRQPILVKEAKNEHLLPNILRDAFDGCLLILPIIDDDEFVGLLLMTRENTSFSDDEIIRLEIASRQIGSFVQNDRRRHIASTLAERQRLIRDLHDSVTQRLYGLVMMTESARLRLSAGAIDNPEKLITELGFNTRQALKEMRLFLYKLQPVDIERNGFIASLLHRLEAVEGRAGLETKLDIDQTLILSLELQVHLYLIAQEVLNNIIKHANAKTVKISFKKARVNIHFKISDDGKGFDPQKANRAGLGMMNIRERAKIIGAKLKIDSAPEKGCTVSVIIRQDNTQSDKAVGEAA